MKKIYKYYKERLIEISGRSRSLYSKKIDKKNSFDIGRLLDGDYDAINDFTDFLWSGKRAVYPLINKDARGRICKNLKIADKIDSQKIDERKMKKDEVANENLRRERIKRDETKKAIAGQVSNLKALKREIEEFSHETGRYELFIGYPFVEGSIGREMVVRAPLLLFPAVIHIDGDDVAEIELKQNEPVQLNKVFLFAYAKRFRLNIEELIMEFSSLAAARLKNIDDVVAYLRKTGFKLSHPIRKGMFGFEHAKEPHLGDPIEVRHYAVIGRFPLANAIYNDYSELEKHKPTDAIRELLESRNPKKIKKPNTDLYVVNQLDFAQQEAIGKLNQTGNMVIYGPPGTGKSQTIVNIITDALCKNKRVLVVSQKKAALDVVYNRLGTLNDKVMYINDPEKNKADFYARTKATHLEILNNNGSDPAVYESKYNEIKTSVDREVAILQSISDTLFTPTAFGPSLQEMYARSYIFGKDSIERLIYKQMLKNPAIMKLNFYELDNTVRIIKEKRKAELYYKRLAMNTSNPFISHIKDNLDMHTINTARSFITKLLSKRFVPFDISRYPNARQLLAFYLENGLASRHDLKPIIRFIAGIENPRLATALRASYFLFPSYPFVRHALYKKEKQIADNFDIALKSIQAYVNEYALLETILDKKGFAMTIENILNGNNLFLKMLLSALENYVDVRDMNLNMKEMKENEMLILNFAYENVTTMKEFKEVIDKLVVARIYHELVQAELKLEQPLSKIMDYENIKNRIVSLKDEQKDIVRKMCLEMFKKSYSDLYKSDPNNKNFFYQIGKAQGFWPMRKLMEVYSDLMFALFPCWLLSPESVSTIMPLKQNLFDLILFDEASQIFIESTLPTIYRGRHIAVAGDNKQLRPTSLFLRRYMGNDTDDLDLSTQAALEVESLLDLATSRYSSINLNYHYRSKHEEFINFSNHAFYDCKLQIAPNISKNSGSRSKPIERVKVEGQWLERKNREEGMAVIRLLKKIFKNRKENETVGIVTFNSEQEQYIEDLIDAECERDIAFRNVVLKESNRKENGEDVSMFVKNLENVQGDERDIIIFSIGYAKNEFGKVMSHFGPLNMEGGENRLNVAITRAKKKIYLVTSIEPEELNVEGAKNAGPKIFKKYLQYVRAVSNGSVKEVDAILQSFKAQNSKPKNESIGVAGEIKTALEKIGYTVEMNLGNNSYKLSLAIYDKKLDKYLIGIECDDAAFMSSESVIERDVFRSKFLEGRGWEIIRVWSRDWWQSPVKVLNLIDRKAKQNKNNLAK